MKYQWFTPSGCEDKDKKIWVCDKDLIPFRSFLSFQNGFALNQMYINQLNFKEIKICKFKLINYIKLVLPCPLYDMRQDR